MAYRDPLESRRAHLERLEAQLAELKADEARLRSLPDGGSLLERFLGGRGLVQRTIRVQRAPDAEELAARASEAFDIEGRLAREGEAMLWRAEPEPRPRRVEVRSGADAEGAFVHVRDESSQRSVIVFFVLLGMIAYGLQRGAGLVATLLLVALGVGFAAYHRRTRRLARRRLWQADRLARSLTASTVTPLRVAGDAEQEEEAEEPLANAGEARGERRARNG